MSGPVNSQPCNTSHDDTHRYELEDYFRAKFERTVAAVAASEAGRQTMGRVEGKYEELIAAAWRDKSHLTVHGNPLQSGFTLVAHRVPTVWWLATSNTPLSPGHHQSWVRCSFCLSCLGWCLPSLPRWTRSLTEEAYSGPFFPSTNLGLITSPSPG